MVTADQPLIQRSVPWLWLILPAALLWGGHLALMHTVEVPQKGDELVYLGNARYLATGQGLVDDTGRDPYKVGYSLLLLPAFWIDATPLGGFAAVQWINSVLLTCLYPLLFFLARRLAPHLETLDHALLAVVLSCYPAVWLYGTTAMSENAFLPLFVAVTLSVHRALASGRGLDWGLVGGVTLFLYFVHERALGILVAVTLLACVVGLRTLRTAPRSWGWSLYFVVASMMFALLRRVEVPGSRWQTGARSSDFVERAVTLSDTLWQTVVGHLWYLLLASFGCLLYGLALRCLEGYRLEGYRALRTDETAVVQPSSVVRPSSRAPWLFWPWLSLAAGSVLVTSIIFLAPRGAKQFTLWVYGRYGEGVLLPVLLVAVLALRPCSDRSCSDRPWKRPTSWWPWMVAAAVGVTLTFTLDALWTPAVGLAYSFNASSLPIFSWPAGPGILRSGAVFLLFSGLLWLLFLWRWRAGLVALGSLFLLSTGVTLTDSWIERATVTGQQHQLANLIRQLDPPRKVILQEPRGKAFHFHYYNLSYFLPEYRFSTFGRKLQENPPGDLVLSGDFDFARRHPGAQLLGHENMPEISLGYRQTLWVLPGAFSHRLAAQGYWAEKTSP